MQLSVKVRSDTARLKRDIQRAKDRAMQAGGKAAGRKWQDRLLRELEAASRESQSGRKWRSLPKRSARASEPPADQGGTFWRSWRAGKVSVTPQGRGRALLRAVVVSEHPRTEYILRGQVDWWGNWQGFREAEDDLRQTYIAVFESAMERELRRAGL